MRRKTRKTIAGIILAMVYVASMIAFASAVIIDADFITVFPGEEGKVNIEIDNNENFDIEDVSVALELGEIEGTSFTSVGSSEKDVDNIDEDDDDAVSFTLRASTDIVPGDYNIPYTIKYTNADNVSETFEKEGGFGLRVSARTDIDFAEEINENPILGREGQITLEIINRGLGEIKSVSVQILPNGFDLVSKDKIFIGTVDSDDSDTASFDVIYRSTNPTLAARVEYKDFDNRDFAETVNIPLRVYTEDEALELGLISKSNTWIYILVIAILVVAWLIWRRIKKRRKQRKRMEERR